MQAPRSTRVRLAIWSDRLVNQVVAALEVVNGGFWLGALDGVHVRLANKAAYRSWDRYRSVSYNRSGLAEWEQIAATKHFAAGGSVLVPSAGAGRELLGLESLGFQPTGFDPSPDLVAIGTTLLGDTNTAPRLILSDPDVVPPGLPRSFDAVLFGWGGYSHIRGRETRIAILRSLRAHLAEGSPLVISFLTRAEDGRRFALIRSLALAVKRLRRSPEAVELGDTVAGSFDHYFTWSEIRDELGEGGFAEVAASSVPYPHIVCRAA